MSVTVSDERLEKLASQIDEWGETYSGHVPDILLCLRELQAVRTRMKALQKADTRTPAPITDEQVESEIGPVAWRSWMPLGEWWALSNVVENTDAAEPLYPQARIDADGVTIAALRATAKELSAAIEPFADAVFNDNGDMTVEMSAPGYDDFVKAYLALRKYRAALEAAQRPHMKMEKISG